jgi:hypothetical protein
MGCNPSNLQSGVGISGGVKRSRESSSGEEESEEGRVARPRVVHTDCGARHHLMDRALPRLDSRLVGSILDYCNGYGITTVERALHLEHQLFEDALQSGKKLSISSIALSLGMSVLSLLDSLHAVLLVLLRERESVTVDYLENSRVKQLLQAQRVTQFHQLELRNRLNLISYLKREEKEFDRDVSSQLERFRFLLSGLTAPNGDELDLSDVALPEEAFRIYYSDPVLFTTGKPLSKNRQGFFKPFTRYFNYHQLVAARHIIVGWVGNSEEDLADVDARLNQCRLRQVASWGFNGRVLIHSQQQYAGAPLEQPLEHL